MWERAPEAPVRRGPGRGPGRRRGRRGHGRGRRPRQPGGVAGLAARAGAHEPAELALGGRPTHGPCFWRVRRARRSPSASTTASTRAGPTARINSSSRSRSHTSTPAPARASPSRSVPGVTEARAHQASVNLAGLARVVEPGQPQRLAVGPRSGRGRARHCPHPPWAGSRRPRPRGRAPAAPSGRRARCGRSPPPPARRPEGAGTVGHGTGGARYRAFALATAPSQAADGRGVRVNVVRSTATSPKVGR